jgi:hypothetical protein
VEDHLKKPRSPPTYKVLKSGMNLRTGVYPGKNPTIYYPILPKYDLEVVINELMICRKLVYKASRILCYLLATVIAE